MMIGDAIDEDAAKELENAGEDFLRRLAGIEFTQFLKGEVMREKGGLMVIINTWWYDSGNPLKEHEADSCRAFVAATDHLLIRGFVVKVFERKKTVLALK